MHRDHHVRMSIVRFDGIFWGVILVRGKKNFFLKNSVLLCLFVKKLQERQRKEKKIKIKFLFCLKFEKLIFFLF